MSVTAARLGSAPITIDWSNLANVSSGSGTPVRKFGPDKEAFEEAWAKLKSRFSADEVGFYQVPVHPELSQAQESEALAQSILASGRFTDCLFLGIGGSSLGPLSLLFSLQERCKSGIKFHFMENPDATDWKSTISRLNPASTLVCSVTKSGTTFETMAQTLLALEWLGKDRWKTHLVAITDPSKGDLKAFATQNGIPTLHIAPSMGGRFSVFTPVGLFPAALAGLSVSEILNGAKQVRDFVEKAPHEKNPLFILGGELIRHYPKRSVHVCMPYSTRLKQISAWFVQLWGESLGKDGKGFTPIAAVGATDQHSILQLLRDGPDDKVTLFLTVDQVEDEVRIPKLSSMGVPLTQLGYGAFKLLEGHTLQGLLTTEYRATALVLTKQGRPNVTWQLDRLDERGLGALYFAFSVLTAFTGTLWGVNPFDQPGVEEGKIYTREALSRGGISGAPGSGYGSGNFDDTRTSDGRDEDENSPVNRLRRDRDS
jgi:glucose-6-phosphate isomerase